MTTRGHRLAGTRSKTKAQALYDVISACCALERLITDPLRYQSPSNSPPSRNHVDQHYRDGHNQENMDEPSQSIRCDYSKQPQNEQYYENGPEHLSYPPPVPSNPITKWQRREMRPKINVKP
jgi:hypothetical protein